MITAAGIAAVGAGLIGTGVNATDAATVGESSTADLYLVKYHADWCPKCVSLVSPWDEAKAELATEDANILFVQLDRTDKSSSRQSSLLSAELGLSEQWNTYSRKNGTMVLFDSEGSVIREFRKGTTSSDIVAAVRDAG
ncbi:MAG: thioredoxin domain-containing protein [Planctomycetota bacterium]